MRSSSLISMLALTILALLPALSRALVTESYVRVQHEPDGGKVIVMRDFARIVQLDVDREGNLRTCSLIKRNELIEKMVAYEKQELTGDLNVHYLNLTLDVAWYGRYCSKITRDRARANDRSDRHVANFMDMSAALTGPIGGSLFCVAGKSTRNPSLHTWKVSPTDKCCQSFRNCTMHIPRLNYRFGYMNAYTYDMFSCECTDTFRECLTDVISASEDNSAEVELAREVRRVFFDLFKVKCAVRREVEVCKEYSTWFDECKDSHTIYSTSAKY